MCAGLALLLALTSCRQLVDFEQQTPSAAPTSAGPPGGKIGVGYEIPVRFAMSAARTLSTADYDGDGRLEVLSADEPSLVGQAKFDLHYFDEAGAGAESRAFPWPTTLPIARDLDEDGRSDLVFSNFNVGLLPGRSDRKLLPATFRQFVFPNAELRVAEVRHDNVSGSLGLAFLTTWGGVRGIYVADEFTSQLQRVAELEAPIGQLTGPVTADIVEVSDSPCKELIVAFNGASSFRLLDLCQPGEGERAAEALWRAQPREQVVSLPEGLTIDAGGVLVADVDGDGHLDLLVSSGGQPYVTHGDGQQLETEVAPLGISLPESGGQRLPMPIAAGDLSGDGVADFVLRDQLIVSRPLLDGSGHDYFNSFQNINEPWGLARIADLNGNGLPDVIAAPAGGRRLTFLSGTGGLYQVPTTLSTKQPVQLLATGDFDGDLIGDIAVVEGDDDPGSSRQLTLSFGALRVTPPEPQLVAELEGGTQLASLAANGVDGVVVTSSLTFNGEPGSAMTAFFGDSHRLPLGSSVLTSFSSDGALQSDSALQLAVGTFGAGGRQEIIALGAEWWWLWTDGGTSKTPPLRLDGKLPDYATPLTSDGVTVRVSVAAEAADLDGDGQDESLWLMPRVPEGCQLLISTLDDAGVAMLLQGGFPFEEACLTPQLTVQDFDADGFPDIMVLIGGPETGPRRLQVLWNDGAGGFSIEDQSSVQIRDHDVRGFSAFAAGSRQISIVTDEGLYVVAATAQAPRSLGTPTRVGDFDEPSSVVVTDANGDGFADLAVADAAGLWLLKARPR